MSAWRCDVSLWQEAPSIPLVAVSQDGEVGDIWHLELAQRMILLVPAVLLVKTDLAPGTDLRLLLEL